MRTRVSFDQSGFYQLGRDFLEKLSQIELSCVFENQFF